MADIHDKFHDENTDSEKESFNNQVIGEGIDDVKDHPNDQESKQADQNFSEEEAKAYGSKAEDHKAKEKVTAKEGAYIDSQGDTDKEFSEVIEDQTEHIREESEQTTVQQYSCSYQPPYYVPNFTIPQSEEKKDKSNKKKFGIGALILTLVLALVLSTVGGAAGYLFLRRWDNQNQLNGDQDAGGYVDVNGTGTNTEQGEVNIIKNSGGLKVNESAGVVGQPMESISQVVAAVADSVVEITTSSVVSDSQWGNYVTEGAGSGVIIGETKDGTKSVILTNNHVIEGANEIIVRLRNGSEYTATLVAEGDAENDIAVLVIQKAGLTVATLGNSGALTVGEEVVAIGNPLGELGGTVTDGIISALDRKVIVGGYRMTLLQTNAAINPGNSGGGLFNMAGELVGIVNAKQSDTGIEGLGFAIPIDVAYDVAKDLMEYGYVVGKLSLGFSVQQYAASNVYPAGVYVTDTKVSGLAKNDYIAQMNGVQINTISDYYRVIDTLREGDTLTLIVNRLRQVGMVGQWEQKTVQIVVTVTKAPSNS